MYKDLNLVFLRGMHLKKRLGEHNAIMLPLSKHAPIAMPPLLNAIFISLSLRNINYIEYIY